MNFYLEEEPFYVYSNLLEFSRDSVLATGRCWTCRFPIRGYQGFVALGCSWIQRFVGGQVGNSGGVERWHSSPIGVGCCGSNIDVNDYTP